MTKTEDYQRFRKELGAHLCGLVEKKKMTEDYQRFRKELGAHLCGLVEKKKMSIVPEITPEIAKRLAEESKQISGEYHKRILKMWNIGDSTMSIPENKIQLDCALCGGLVDYVGPWPTRCKKCLDSMETLKKSGDPKHTKILKEAQEIWGDVLNKFNKEQERWAADHLKKVLSKGKKHDSSV